MTIDATTNAQTTTVLLVGVGGQGTILAGDLLAKTAAKSGFDVKISEIHGMSQRGGSVTTSVRFGKCVNSMLVDPGQADIIVAFEEIEALRYLHFLKKDGVLFVNSTKITPVSVHIGNFDMPQNVDERLKNVGADLVDAEKLAKNVASAKSANVVLMGALSTQLPFDENTWIEVIKNRVPQKTIEKNIEAFKSGVKAIKK